MADFDGEDKDFSDELHHVTISKFHLLSRMKAKEKRYSDEAAIITDWFQ